MSEFFDCVCVRVRVLYMPVSLCVSSSQSPEGRRDKQVIGGRQEVADRQPHYHTAAPSLSL